MIGRNGAGKTTLLKILSRITNPTEGEAELRGRVGSLLEVGTGFHPELTGRENIYLSAAILGMRRSEIETRLDEIVAFAEVERFLDTPVKHYSSSMYLRLAFAVAAHLEPEILLIDEVLAVGDASFQRKCLGKMGDVAREGRTVLFVSHNMEAIQRLCERCLLIEGGRLAADGAPHEVVTQYLKQWRAELGHRYRMNPEAATAAAADRALLLEAKVLDSEGNPSHSLRFGEPFSIRMKWRHLPTSPEPVHAVRVYDAQDRLMFAATSRQSGVGEIHEETTHWISCRFDQNVLVPGDFSVFIKCFQSPRSTLHIAGRSLGFKVLDVPYRREHTFNLEGAPLFAPEGRWHIDSA